MSEKKIALLLLALFLLVSLSSFALLAEEESTKSDSQKYGVVYGQDLSEASKVLLFNQFPLNEKLDSTELQVGKITNEEEWQVLRNIVDESEIGNQALSAVYVQTLEKDRGLQVRKHFNSGPSERMYANALFTAGLSDLEFFLTGETEKTDITVLASAFRAAETIGQAILDINKRLAAEELVLTAKLGQRIGEEKAANYLERVKGTDFSAVDQNLTQIMREATKNEDIGLTETEQQEWQQYFQSFQSLKLSADKLPTQLQAFRDNGTVIEDAENQDNWFGKVITFFQTLVDRLFSFVGFGMKI